MLGKETQGFTVRVSIHQFISKVLRGVDVLPWQTTAVTSPRQTMSFVQRSMVILEHVWVPEYQWGEILILQHTKILYNTIHLYTYLYLYYIYPHINVLVKHPHSFGHVVYLWYMFGSFIYSPLFSYSVWVVWVNLPWEHWTHIHTWEKFRLTNPPTAFFGGRGEIKLLRTQTKLTQTQGEHAHLMIKLGIVDVWDWNNTTVTLRCPSLRLHKITLSLLCYL